MANNGLIKRLQNFFNIQTTVNDRGNVEVNPISKKTNKNNDIKNVKGTFPPEMKRLWDWYLSETADTRSIRANRIDRYKDMDYMDYNEPLISMALNLYADEVSQVDDRMQLIKPSSKNPKVVAEIKDLFEKLGINQAYIRETARNLCTYGDSVDIISSNETDGITALTPIDVFDLTDRLEFKASEIEKRLKNVNYSYSNFDKQFSVKDYMKNFAVSSKSDPAAAFMPYLFGFVVGDNNYLAPWQVLHYRLNSRRSEFFPFGRPLFINLVGPYRQLRTSMNFMGLARPMSFPKSVFKVHASDEMTSSEKWEAVNEARQEYSNFGKSNKSREQFALGEEIWLPDELIDFDSIKTDINLDDIGDIELLRDNLIMGTGIPKGYLIVDQGGWGTSNQSLLQQSKPFARACFRIQSEILDRLSFLVRLHFMMTDKFEKEFTEFELTMNFPVVEEASDRLRNKKDSLDFANDIITALKDAIGYNEDDIPVSLVKQIFTKYSFLTADEIDTYINALKQAQSENQEKLEEKFNKHFANRINEEVINGVYFDVCNKHGIKEYNKSGKHVFINSSSDKLHEDKTCFEMFREKNKKN